MDDVHPDELRVRKVNQMVLAQRSLVERMHAESPLMPAATALLTAYERSLCACLRSLHLRRELRLIRV